MAASPQLAAPPLDDTAVPAPAAVTAMSRGAYWLMLQRVAIFAGCVDVLYLVVFFALGMPLMALVNLISMAMYAAAYVLIGRRRNLPAVLLMWTEVLVHSTTCTVLLSWSSGVHYFLLVFISAVAVSRSPRHAGAALAFLLSVYIGLDATTQVIPPRYTLSPDVLTALRWLNMTIVFIMFGYTGRYYIERVSEAETRLRELATRDAMSGLWNRRHLMTLAHAEMGRARRSGYPMVVVMADIDHFKHVNDRYGHDAGDRVIEYVSRMLREHLRSGDLVGRWGGEEFIAVLPSCDTMAAHQLCERLRQRIADTPCQVNGVPIKVTMSFGVHPLRMDSMFEQAVRQADEALYKAKHTGRNRVVSNLPQPVLEGALQV